jgi:hypothetical protein
MRDLQTSICAIVVTAAVAGFVSASAAASQEYRFAGDVDPACSLGASNSTTTTVTGAVATTGTANGLPPSTLTVTPASIAVSCNKSNVTLTVTSRALQHQSGGSGNDPRVMNYTITIANWTSTPMSFRTAETSTSLATSTYSVAGSNPSPTSQALTVSATAPASSAGSGKVRGGSYSATIGLSVAVMP